MKLLIIDDEPHIRQMMRLTLEAAGYEVEEAAGGEEGLGTFRDAGHVDAVLLDQKMPGIDGLQTLQRLKAHDPAVCVVMVTAVGSIELAVDAMRLGATDFLRKPMTPELLRGAVAAAIASGPRAGVARAPLPVKRTGPRIETLTLNGFRILRAADVGDAAKGEHGFRVKHFPDGAEFAAVVAIDPEAVARVTRLSRRALAPGGAFWLQQAERALAGYLWSEGTPPEHGHLTVHDVSRDDLEMAVGWELD
jgi:FixJ family two-component response regulator